VKNLFTTRKRIVIAGVAASAVILGTGGAAYAYFAASGTGTGSATVGAAGTWTVTPGQASGGPLYPDGTSSETIAFTVHNDSSGQQEYTSATAAVAKDGNNFITQSNNPVGNCYAGWFNAAIANAADDPGINKEISAGASTTVTVTVTMPADGTDNQTACAGTKPDITLNIS
jgi:hypothetical protein